LPLVMTMREPLTADQNTAEKIAAALGGTIHPSHSGVTEAFANKLDLAMHPIP
jgi:hypothetical protein